MLIRCRAQGAARTERHNPPDEEAFDGWESQRRRTTALAAAAGGRSPLLVYGVGLLRDTRLSLRAGLPWSQRINPQRGIRYSTRTTISERGSSARA